MNISIITFTDKGTELAEKLKRAFEHTPVHGDYNLITIEKRKKEDNHKKASGNDLSLSEWTREQFFAKNAIVFIGACGIAVRLIAPFVTDKLTDSPVVVLDEAGTFAIPLLSGHMGGANELAGEIARLIGAGYYNCNGCKSYIFCRCFCKKMRTYHLQQRWDRKSFRQNTGRKNGRYCDLF